MSFPVVLVWICVLFIYIDRRLWTVEPHDCLLTSCTGVVLLVVKRSSYSRIIGLSGLCTFSAPLYSPLHLSRALQTRLRHRFPRQVVGTVTNARESLRFALPALLSRLLSFGCRFVVSLSNVLSLSSSRWGKNRPWMSAVSVNYRLRSTSAFDQFLVNGQAKLVLIRKWSSGSCSGSSVK